MTTGAAQLAALPWCKGDGVDFSYTPAEEAFRQQVRAWLEPNVYAHRAQWGEDEDEFTQHPSSPASMAWHKRMYAGGWVGMHTSSALTFSSPRVRSMR